MWHGRVDDEPAPCCNNCLEEVFNVLFVLTHKGEYLVYCHRCATAMRKSFTVLQQVSFEIIIHVVVECYLFSIWLHVAVSSLVLRLPVPDRVAMGYFVKIMIFGLQQ